MWPELKIAEEYISTLTWAFSCESYSITILPELDKSMGFIVSIHEHFLVRSATSAPDDSLLNTVATMAISDLATLSSVLSSILSLTFVFKIAFLLDTSEALEINGRSVAMVRYLKYQCWNADNIAHGTLITIMGHR